MADQKSHTAQWLHNRQFIQAIDPAYLDWIVTATFYAALHAVDTLLAFDKTTRVYNHKTRNDALEYTSRYAKIWFAYYPLYSLSQTVRYVAEPSKWVRASHMESEVFRRLYDIEKSVKKLAGLDLNLEPLKVVESRRTPTTTDA